METKATTIRTLLSKDSNITKLHNMNIETVGQLVAYLLQFDSNMRILKDDSRGPLYQEIRVSDNGIYKVKKVDPDVAMDAYSDVYIDAGREEGGEWAVVL